MVSWRGAALLLGVLLGAFALAAPALAADITVTTVADTVDAGACGTVTIGDLPGGDMALSLREAICAANNTAGADTILFYILGGVRTIQPTSALPDITEALTIDGYSQPGASANSNPIESGSNAVILIELDGTNAGGGLTSGLVINAPNVTVRGLAINRFAFRGIQVNAAGTDAVIAGNYVGTDPAGTTDLGNGTQGVIVVDATGVTVGGTLPADRNVISGNGEAGVDIAAPGLTVQGNIIGLNAAGTTAIANGFYGVYVNGANATIGGATAGSRNVISGNNLGGVRITPAGTGLTVQGNYIGLDAAGSNGIVAPSGQGVIFSLATPAAMNAQIGGTAAGQGNRIAYNSQQGVYLNGGPTGVRIVGNEIFSNGGVGIDLSGGNNNQAAPVLTTATRGASGTSVVGTLTSTGGTLFDLHFYANAACDPSGSGEGQQYLGSSTVGTDGGGTATINVSGLAAATAGSVITATATDPSGNTSQFSACITAAAPGITVAPTNGLVTTETGGTATFTVVLDSAPGDDVMMALSSNDTTEGTVNPTSLTFTSANWSVPQTVTVTGADDLEDDGDVAYTILTGAASSLDPLYAAINPADVGVTNTDDDVSTPTPTPTATPTLTLTPTSTPSGTPLPTTPTATATPTATVTRPSRPRPR